MCIRMTSAAGHSTMYFLTPYSATSNPKTVICQITPKSMSHTQDSHDIISFYNRQRPYNVCSRMLHGLNSAKNPYETGVTLKPYVKIP